MTFDAEFNILSMSLTNFRRYLKKNDLKKKDNLNNLK